ncbi:nicotinate-nucleotide adenylyltransferase [Magnetospira sp. QH-2]|uniref:nicotinate-nucleotide adenylyltransferase n=1 Tax=Magnetospira sp. (strain QH-2) TaxID=1288970 RepID=UPI0003E80D5A|nr:nicotinate-nucleotide adenylyltransferase [Magnetospira sp. QH-2]CCQ75155.1 putative nicotinate-nucleotide adenylyltransferase [Magnetospira sp. QH-2]
MSGRGLRIGLLGGSFNPAHEGHLHISREALRRLRLDQVWWLVSPGNPLKPAHGMGKFEDRWASAQALTKDERRMKVTDLETRLGTRYTADTLRQLTQRNPRTCFIWLMGADNLAQIPRWWKWTSIFHRVPVAVFARPTYASRALSGAAAVRFARARVGERQAFHLANRTPPAWTFLFIRQHTASATAIRARGGFRT